MDAREFLHCAASLLQIGTHAANRSAVSRAYYGAFHVAKTHLEANGFRFLHNDRSHGEVNRFLSWSGDPQLAIAVTRLSDLRGVRNKADYDLASPKHDAGAHAKEWLDVANRCVRIMDEAFASNRKDAIIQAIKANQ